MIDYEKLTEDEYQFIYNSMFCYSSHLANMDVSPSAEFKSIERDKRCAFIMHLFEKLRRLRNIKHETVKVRGEDREVSEFDTILPLLASDTISLHIEKRKCERCGGEMSQIAGLGTDGIWRTSCTDYKCGWLYEIKHKTEFDVAEDGADSTVMMEKCQHESDGTFHDKERGMNPKCKHCKEFYKQGE